MKARRKNTKHILSESEHQEFLALAKKQKLNYSKLQDVLSCHAITISKVIKEKRAPKIWLEILRLREAIKKLDEVKFRIAELAIFSEVAKFEESEKEKKAHADCCEPEQSNGGAYPVKETEQTVNLLSQGSSGSLPEAPTKEQPESHA